MHSPEPINELVGKWRSAVRTLKSYGGEAPALTLETCANELEEALQDWKERPLTLSEASDLSGYSSDHLGRLVRDGTIPNAGRHGAPRIHRQDLPMKPGAVAYEPPGPHVDLTQIVRSAIASGG